MLHKKRLMKSDACGQAFSSQGLAASWLTQPSLLTIMLMVVGNRQCLRWVEFLLPSLTLLNPQPSFPRQISSNTFNKMSFKSTILLILLSSTSAFFLKIPQARQTLALPASCHAHEAVVTPSPRTDHLDLKRQTNNYCTQWTLLGGKVDLFSEYRQ